MQTTLSKELTLAQRLAAPTPKIFRTFRTIGLVLLAISGTIVATPLAVPVIVTQIAGYIALAGSVVTAVSQVAVDEKAMAEKAATTEWKEEVKE